MGLAVLLGCLPASQTPPDTEYRFDSSLAWASLLKQCSFGPRVPGTDAQVQCRDYILQQAQQWGENVRLQPFEHNWTVTRSNLKMWNVIAEQNYRTAAHRILILTHYDSRPFADQEEEPTLRNKPILGANDGASGVAVQLELMRIMKDHLPKDVGVLYLFVDGEDLGPDDDEMYLGAVAYAKDFAGGPKPDYGILLDMVGGNPVSFPIEDNSNVFCPELTKAFYDQMASAGLGLYFPQKVGYRIIDDHIKINEAGVPCIDLISFDYKPWHTTKDTPENCSEASLKIIGHAMENWLRFGKYTKPNPLTQLARRN
ncbi:MAG: M28 family peptidase [Armatimonadetes bacterium]|nr:M28 family peptidase [Armatimonadota bacterium]